MQKGSNKSLLKLEKKVGDLLKRVDLLEKSNREMRKWALHEKKKVKIIPWLNKHFSPTKDFSQWIEELVVGNRGLQQVFANRFMTGAYYIILNNLPIEERDNFPIISFAHKRRLLYIYEDKSWVKMEDQNFADLIQSINIKLFKQFTIWEKENPALFDDPERREWNNSLKKILLVPDKKEYIIKNIRQKIHNYLKLNLNNVVKYEFLF